MIMKTLFRVVKRNADFYVNCAREWIDPFCFPAREYPVYVNLVIHAEYIAVRKIFNQLLSFVTTFHRITGVKSIVCVMTPECPIVRSQMADEGISDADYAERLADLLPFTEIGYHGHFFAAVTEEEMSLQSALLLHERMSSFRSLFWQDGDGRWMVPVGHHNYEQSVVRGQFLKEMQWFSEKNIYPKIYSAGWWFLNTDIVNLLEKAGFIIDCSIRKYHLDTFGMQYLCDKEIPPRGEVFPLPPSRTLFEVQSVFYPVQHPYAMNTSYRALASHAPNKPLFAIIPLHEGEIQSFHGEVMKHVEKLSQWDAFAWLSVERDMWKISRNVFTA